MEEVPEGGDKMTSQQALCESDTKTRKQPCISTLKVLNLFFFFQSITYVTYNSAPDVDYGLLLGYTQTLVSKRKVLQLLSTVRAQTSICLHVAG